MKRFLNGLVIIALLVTGYLPAYADILSLPSNVPRIEEETFYGDISLEEVQIPFGTTYIGPRAFGYTSVEYVHIPVTVDTIADDAFEGSGSVVISSPARAYAREYAQTHNIEWEEENNYTLKEELESYDQQLDFDADTFEPDTTDIATYPTSGVTDPDKLAAIQEYNALNAELMEAYAASDDSLRELEESLTAFSNDLQAYNLTENGGTISFNSDEYKYEMSAVAFGGIQGNSEETTYTVNGDTIQVGINNNGKDSYILLKDNSFSISDNAPLVARNTKNIALLSRAARNSIGIDFVEGATNKIEKALDVVDIALAGLKLKRTRKVELSKQAWEKAVEFGDAIEIEKAYDRYWNAQRSLKKLTGFLEKFTVKCLPVLGLLATATSDTIAWRKLDDYVKHNHPVGYESEDEIAMEIIRQVNRDIGLGKAYYLADAAVALIGAIAQSQAAVDWIATAATIAVPGLGEIVALKATLELIISLVSAGTGVVLQNLADKKMAAVESNDARLHANVTGTVKDFSSDAPIANVKVVSGDYSTTTDKDGRYTLRLDSSTVTFSRKGYADISKPVDSQYQGTLLLNAQMPKLYTLSGMVKNQAGAPLIGATVSVSAPSFDYSKTTTTNKSGFYVFNVPVGAIKLSASYGRYKSGEKNTTIVNATLYDIAIDTSDTQSYEVGSTVTFGHYDQDNDASNGKESISWIVLKNDGNTATLISVAALEAKAFNTGTGATTWETSTLRTWLNSGFLNTAFTSEEQAKLATVSVKAEKHPSYSTNAGNDTLDKVYLLSVNEAKTFFPSNSSRMCRATQTARAHGAANGYEYYNYATCWSLRTPGRNNSSNAYVYLDGTITDGSAWLDDGGVRPVIAIKLV